MHTVHALAVVSVPIATCVHSSTATHSVVDYDCVSFVSSIGTVGGLSLREGAREESECHAVRTLSLTIYYGYVVYKIYGLTIDGLSCARRVAIWRYVAYLHHLCNDFQLSFAFLGLSHVAHHRSEQKNAGDSENGEQRARRHFGKAGKSLVWVIPSCGGWYLWFEHRSMVCHAA